MKITTILVGAGPMAIEYAKVLQAQNVDFITIGNSKEGAINFETQIKSKVIIGGIETWLEKNPHTDYSLFKAIVAVNENLLGSITRKLINVGFKDILVEKPGGLNFKDIQSVNNLAIKNNAKVYVAYNRRFLSSTLKVQELIKLEGGVTSFNFEFTEWGHIVQSLVKNEGVLEEWLIQNSSHVIDLAFFIGGHPTDLKSFVSGGASWHPSGTVFSGAGVTSSNALFSYNANWDSAGRWWVEFLTKENRYIMKPMEKLFVQKRGSVAVNEIEINNDLDLLYKPGLFKQVEAFMKFEDRLMKIEEQIRILPIYQEICKK